MDCTLLAVLDAYSNKLWLACKSQPVSEKKWNVARPQHLLYHIMIVIKLLLKAYLCLLLRLVRFYPPSRRPAPSRRCHHSMPSLHPNSAFPAPAVKIHSSIIASMFLFPVNVTASPQNDAIEAIKKSMSTLCLVKVWGSLMLRRGRSGHSRRSWFELVEGQD